MSLEQVKRYAVFIMAVFPDSREEFVVSCEAYSAVEANFQMAVEIDAQHNVAQRGGRFVLLSVGPDTLETAERFHRLRREMGLLRQKSATTA